MNDLQKLIKLRGLTVLGIAKAIGHGYHMVQKVIKGTRYKLKDGSFGTYSNLEVQQAVAAQLGLTHDQAWGPKSRLFLRRLIRKEINNQAKQQAKRQAKKLQEQFLSNNRIAEKKAVGNV
jgi:hypothetical protein